MGDNASKTHFTRNLLHWNSKDNDRKMPWKGEKNPYRIWLSEIILQQTRVEQGLEYYNRFIKTYPTISKLAAAPEEKVFKLWEGLGYYSRCRNLIATARYIATERKGVFPSTYEDILALKGVGPYTAAAIASFAFNLPHAVVDGNVFRVLARYFGIATDTMSSAGKKRFTSLANELLDKTSPGVYNQAIMDFGAMVCKPQSPLCSACPLRIKCVAFRDKKVESLPVKTKQLAKKKRWFCYLVIEQNNKVLVRKRTAKDIWQNLHEFVLVETPRRMPPEKFLQARFYKQISRGNQFRVQSISGTYIQQLSHQTIEGYFLYIRAKKMPVIEGFEPVPVSRLPRLAFPRFISRYLAEKG